MDGSRTRRHVKRAWRNDVKEIYLLIGLIGSVFAPGVVRQACTLAHDIFTTFSDYVRQVRVPMMRFPAFSKSSVFRIQTKLKESTDSLCLVLSSVINSDPVEKGRDFKQVDDL
jgi:hypothetical protein